MWSSKAKASGVGSSRNSGQALSSQVRTKGKGPSAGRESTRSHSVIPGDQAANTTIKHQESADSFGFAAWSKQRTKSRVEPYWSPPGQNNKEHY